ncbi:MAG: PilZ domain [Clostridiales bacterium]|jgi:hypothetical protein|nr:PilZ domain [Clostridiales bacterium]MDN5299199.1 PilZ domain [Clostridiales bacterium]
MERRQAKRVRNLGEIESYSFQGDNRLVEINRPNIISLKDISTGGLGIQSATKFEAGTTLSIDLIINETSFVVIGRIVWCRENGIHYDCGLRLIYIPDDLENIIDAYDEEVNPYIN